MTAKPLPPLPQQVVTTTSCPSPHPSCMGALSLWTVSSFPHPLLRAWPQQRRRETMQPRPKPRPLPRPRALPQSTSMPHQNMAQFVMASSPAPPASPKPVSAVAQHKIAQQAQPQPPSSSFLVESPDVVPRSPCVAFFCLSLCAAHDHRQ